MSEKFRKSAFQRVDVQSFYFVLGYCYKNFATPQRGGRRARGAAGGGALNRPRRAPPPPPLDRGRPVPLFSVPFGMWRSGTELIVESLRRPRRDCPSIGVGFELFDYFYSVFVTSARAGVRRAAGPSERVQMLIKFQGPSTQRPSPVRGQPSP
ncbi:hypothetical protein EVAR_35379_1 [Eumeta japonica]|uniref:Uncharacterized protein n=1 Tax=Eumeta variegata TaxID=151549 RepID=A0A4C1XD02_EUMVA|nr:hypothetical protein EVAR_35379_1 [Eumeta japonica]